MTLLKFVLLQALKKMKADWEAMNFNFVPYKDTDVNILSAFDDIQVLLDDHIVKMTTMKNSPFIKPFEAEINEWDQKLVSVQVVIVGSFAFIVCVFQTLKLSYYIYLSICLSIYLSIYLYIYIYI